MTELAREYGAGLYELATEENIREEIHEQLKVLLESFRENPDFLRLLDTHGIRLEERFSVLDEVLAGRVHSYILNFMKILCERGAIGAFEDCAAYFHRRFNQDFGITEASVATAVPLSEDRAEALRKKLESVSGKKVVLIQTVDPQLIGGVRVEMDGRRMDNTIQTQLEQFRRSLTGSF